MQRAATRTGRIEHDMCRTREVRASPPDLQRLGGVVKQIDVLS